MFEKSIDQIEGFFPLIWFALILWIFIGIIFKHISRIFEYDIYYNYFYS